MRKEKQETKELRGKFEASWERRKRRILRARAKCCPSCGRELGCNCKS